jgi:hypothetical protein
MSRGFVSLAAILLLAGCGAAEIRTPGTENRNSEALARLVIPVHHPELRGVWDKPHVQGVFIDEIAYDLDSDDVLFWLLPGPHKVRLQYDVCRHWPSTWWFHLSLGVSDVSPFCSPLDAKTGRSYRLRCVTSGTGSVRSQENTFDDETGFTEKN